MALLLSQTTTFDSSNIVKFEYEGSGTLYNLSWGNGFKYKGIHVGFNIGYLFGKLNNNTLAYQINPAGGYDVDGYTICTKKNKKTLTKSVAKKGGTKLEISSLCSFLKFTIFV